MPRIVLVSLLHRHAARFPVYPVAQLCSLLSAHPGKVWLPPCEGEEIAALTRAAADRPLGQLASLAQGWCELGIQPRDGDKAGLALAQYDEELLDNLTHYWSSAERINRPITDNLFELRREVVDEALGSSLRQGWLKGQQARLKQLLTNGEEPQIAFVEVEACYWLRAQLAEQRGVELIWPEL